MRVFVNSAAFFLGFALEDFARQKFRSAFGPAVLAHELAGKSFLRGLVSGQEIVKVAADGLRVYPKAVVFGDEKVLYSKVGKDALYVGNKAAQAGAVALGICKVAVKNRKQFLCVGGTSVFINQIGQEFR